MSNTAKSPEKYLSIHGWFDYEDLYSKVYEDLGDTAHIAEVGCWLGRSACFMGELIKNGGKQVRFDCIDLWRHPRTEWSDALIKGNKENQTADFVSNLDIAGVLETVNVIQLSSLEAVNVYADQSLDFIFIDNDHSEEHVFEELNAWWPKLKKGGTLAGHDYSEEHWPGVVNAVKRFAKSKRKKHSVMNNSYLMVK